MALEAGILAGVRAALAKNDAVKQKPDWLQFFLQTPKDACDQFGRIGSGNNHRLCLRTKVQTNAD